MGELEMNNLLFTLAGVITPGHYVVLSQDKEHREKILCMEELLTKEMQFHGQQEFHDLDLQTYVAVEDPEKERNFKRGLVKSKIDKSMYEVFLVDYGQFINVERSKIQQIVKKDFTEIKSLAFTVILYGLIPTTYCVEEKRRASQKWCPEAEAFARNFFKTTNEVKVKSIEVKAGIVYGDILFKPNPNKEFVSLRKILCRHGFCVYSEIQFRDTVFNAAGETNTAERKISEILNVPFHCRDSKVIMSSVDEVPKKEKEYFKFHETCSGKSNLDDPENSYSLLSTSTFQESENYVRDVWTKQGLGRGQRLLSLAKKDVFKGSTSVGNIYFPPRVEQSIRKSEVKTNACKEEEDDILETSSSKIKNKRISWEEVFLQPKINRVWSDSYGSPLVLFRDSVVKPVDSFTEVPIKSTVISNLQRKCKFTRLSPLQRWTIPSIHKNNNLVMIGNSQAGKTLSYVITVADFLQNDIFFSGPSDGNGPFVVILCSSIQTGEFVYDMFHSLIGNHGKNERLHSKIKIFLVRGCDTEEQIWVKLTNGCHVLISTPHCLERLLQMHMLTNLERLKCLILDEVDVLTQEPFKRPVWKVLEIANFSTKNRHYQKIFCGKKWTPEVKSLVDLHIKSYVMVISSYLEVAIYAKLKPTIYVVEEKNKMDVALEKIANQIGKFKILIACERETEANRLGDFLKDKNINTLIAHENLMDYELADICSKWNCDSPYPVLIATDCALTHLDIRDAQILVHFTLPYKSKTNFFIRYSTLLDNVFGNEHFQALEETSDYTDMLLMENEDVHQFPHIIEYILRLGGNVAPKALEMYHMIRRRIELNKINVPLCKKVLSFGSCRNKENCSYRHAFEKLRDSPKSKEFFKGWITFIVTDVTDVSSFSAKLLHLIQPNGEKVEISGQSLQVSVLLDKYYRLQDSRRPHGFPKIGDICAIKRKIKDKELFYRVHIIGITEVDNYNNPLTVNVRLLDQGDVIESKSTDLYSLPDDLASFPPLAVEINVVGIQPWDYENSWDDVAVKFAKDILTRNLEENQYWSGKIVLMLNNTIFLQPVMLKRFLPNLKGDIVEFIYQDKLLSNKMAVKNTEHLPRLLELCLEGDIEQIKEEDKSGNLVAKRIVEPKWAFFDKNFVRVKFSAAENANIIFLQPKKFERLLNDVEDACQEEAAEVMKKIEAGLVKDPKCLGFCPGMYCLAQFEGRVHRISFIHTNKNHKNTLSMLQSSLKDKQLKIVLAPNSQHLKSGKRKPSVKSFQNFAGLKLSSSSLHILRWNRGRIESIDDRDYLIYFIDHGDFVFIRPSHVIPISEKLLLQLPAQAIECNLVGIKEKEEFSEEILDEIYNFSNDGQNDLYAYIINKDLKPTVTGGHKYTLNLLNMNGISLNKFLVDRQIVKAIDSEEHYIEDIQIVVSESSRENSPIRKSRQEEEEEEANKEYFEKESFESDENEPLGESSDIKNLEKYLEEMSGNKDVRLFLEEFASRFLGIPKAVFEESTIKNTDYSCDHFSKNFVDFEHSQSEDNKSFPKNENETQKDCSEGRDENDTIFKKYEQVSHSPKMRTENEEIFTVLNRKNVLTPQVLWFQTHSEIRLKVILDNVENYKLNSTTTNLLFRCLVREKIYAVDLKLFGVINPSMTTIIIQTFHVIIKLKKLSFPLWPRLHKDDMRCGWITADVEDLHDPDEVNAIGINSVNGDGDSKAMKYLRKELNTNEISPFPDFENSNAENQEISSEKESEMESECESEGENNYKW